MIAKIKFSEPITISNGESVNELTLQINASSGEVKKIYQNVKNNSSIMSYNLLLSELRTRNIQYQIINVLTMEF